MTPAPVKPWLPLLLSGATIVALGALIGAILIAAAPQRASASQSPIGIIATPTPGALDPTPAGLARAINAYGAPDPATLIGPVESGRAYTVVARSPDNGWLQLDVVGSGLVWTPVESVDGVDVGALAIVAPAPATAPPAPVVVQQPAPVVVYSAPATAPQQTYPTPDADGNICQDDRCWNVNAPTVVYVADPRTLPTPDQHEKPSDKPAPGWHAPLKIDQGETCGGADTVAPLCH